MFYKSYADLTSDLRDWALHLPPCRAIAGIPRAGSLVASLLALRLNVPLLSLDAVLAGQEAPAAPLRRAGPSEGPILMVDDAVDTGNTLRAVKERLPSGDYRFAAYVAGPGKAELDHYCYDVGGEAHLFEWCVLRHPLNGDTLTDLDGVLCPDWPHPSEEGSLALEYMQHLDTAPCLIKPGFKIKGIVTARLEQHRPRTENWLARNGIEYEFLAMAPYRTPQERAAANGWVGHKTRVYRDWGSLFVESEPYQAEQIHKGTGKPVLDWRNQRLLGGSSYKPAHMRLVFSHGGDVGDTIAALPYIRSQGGGRLFLVRKPGIVREPYTREKVDRLRPLLERACPYLAGVEYAETPKGTDIDVWRSRMRGWLNLADYVSQAFGVPHYPRNEPWLWCREPNPVAPLVCHRSPRYHNSPGLWRRVLATYAPEDRVFVGLPQEHEAFQREFGPIAYYPTADYWELARVIAGAGVYVGNQSSPLWVALGLCLPGQRIIVEECPTCRNCHWDRPGVSYCRDKEGKDVELPCLESQSLN